METSNASKTRRMAIEIDSFDNPTLMTAFADEIGEVLERNVALSLDAQSFVTATVKLLYGTLKANAEGVGRETEDLPHRTGDTGAIRVDIVDGGELSGDLLLQAVRKRVRNLVQDVVRRCHGCKRVKSAHVHKKTGQEYLDLPAAIKPGIMRRPTLLVPRIWAARRARFIWL